MPSPIAVIGMAGRFPGAMDLEELWQNLVDGRDCITDLDDEDLLRRGEYPEYLKHPNYVRRRPCLPAADQFDPRCFGMTPREAEIRDPQQRVLLEVAHSALEHAGYDPVRYPGAIGVFAGTNINRYRVDHLEQDERIRATVAFLALEIANAPDYVATFLSHRLGLTGPSMTLQTACSTGLTAVRTACLSIMAGECDMALAGVCSIEMPLDYGYLQMEGSILARDGRPKPFDADADGTNFGSGCGVVLLKPLNAALADGDTIHAVILGAALNNDGTRKSGFTAPSIEGQAACIADAIRHAGVDPREVSYVEAHGTATKLGDPIEIAGLTEAFRQTAGDALPGGYCAIGSVKSNIGHVGQASGAAGLIKTVLALAREQIPPSINVTRVNPRLRLEDTPFRVATELTPWPRTPGAPRVAGVSSFGIGGTNGHVVLGEAPPPSAASGARAVELLVWSGADEVAADELGPRLADDLEGRTDFADAAYTLRVGRAERRFRRAVVGGPGDVVERLRTGAGVIRRDGPAREVVFCFPGQGAPLARAGVRLYRSLPLFRQHCDEVFDLFDGDLRSLWLSGSALSGTGVVQPVLFALEYALARTLIDLGVRPARLLGHSVGELVAGTVAGVFSLADGVRAVSARAALMAGMPPGAMLAVAGGPAAVQAYLDDDVVLAAVNGERQSVLSGPTELVQAVAAKLTADGVLSTPVDTSHAFHSPMMAPAAAEFARVLGSMTLRAPSVPIVSCATGLAMTDAEATSAAFWAEQLVTPVRFGPAVASLADSFLIETGPGNTLTRLLRGESAVRGGGSVALPVLDADPDASGALERVLGRLWVEGHPVDLARLDVGAGRRRVPVAGYAYQRRRYWVDRPAGHKPPRDNSMIVEPSAVASPAPAVAAAVEPGGSDRWSLGAVEWVRRPDGPAPVVARRTDAARAVLLLPDDRDLAATVRGAFQRAGYRTTRDGSLPASVLVHAGLFGVGPDLATDDLERQLEAGFYGILTAARSASAPVTLAILTSFAVDVTGAEPVNPAAAMVLALARSIEQEHPQIRCVVVDAPPGTAEHHLSAAVVELIDPVAAVRGGTRWTPVLRRLPDRPGPPRLREQGTYLVTGGLGGLGLVVASALADTGLRPRIALLGRTAPRDQRVTAAIAAMEDAGAEVLTVTGDVADRDSLHAALATVENRFGPVNGVVHAAGVPGGGLLMRRERADLDRVLAPKVRGTLHLRDYFDTLDFMVLFSSQAGTAGMLGSADYAAANAFLDAVARQHGRGRTWMCSIAWPGWSEVGMWAESAVDLDAATHGRAPAQASPSQPGGAEPQWRRVLDTNVDWLLDEHRFDGTPMLPGTGSLELIVQAALDLRLLPDDRPLELRETVFVAPVNGSRPIEVGVSFTPSGDQFRFRLVARPAGTDEGWTHHVSGHLVAGDEPPPPVDPAELTGRHSGGDPLPARGRLDLGPRWQSLTRMWNGDGSFVAELALREPFHADLDTHPMHAALLDRAGIAILSAAFPDEPNQHLPFFYRRVTRYAALPTRILAHGRMLPDRPGVHSIDLDVYDAQTGAPVVRVASYTTREIRPTDFTRKLSTPAVSRKATQTDGPPLLKPDDGAAVFLTVLDGNGPPVVVVDPPGGRLTVRGTPWLDAPTPTPTPALVPALVPAPAPQAVPVPVVVEAPATDVVTTLRSLWTEALGVDDVGLDDDFFDLGGDSLVSVQLSARLRQLYQIDISAGVLFEASTIRVLQERLAELGVH